jgi:RND family efflux transporter MFP subunit
MNRSAVETQPELPVDPTRGGVAADPVARDIRGGGILGDGADAPPQPKGGRRWIWILCIAVGAVTLTFGIAAMIGGFGGRDADLVYYTTVRGELPIVVTERGTLESQHEEKIFCEIDDLENDRIHGTKILSVVPNGSTVKKGDVILEYDVTSHVERLDRQFLDKDKAISEQIQAAARFDNQKTQNETSCAEAQLKVDLAELALQQYEDESGGTFQIELQDVELQIQEAQAGKLIEETNLEGVEQLYQLGYRSRGELAQARLSSMRSDRQLASSIAKKKELVAYSYRKAKLQLQGALDSAKRGLKQVERDNTALLVQAEAVTNAANRALEKETERLLRYQKQIDSSKVVAPIDGLLAYAPPKHRRYHEEVAEAATMRPRQHVLSIPDLEWMQIRTFVHESVLDQITSGLPATVRVEAMPGRAYVASVQNVAVLADQARFSSTGTKVYETLVTIDEEVENLKPGMSAVVEIHVARIKNVISVPVQAIVQRGQENWCYVEVGSSPERRDVQLGRSNDKFVVITKGISEGERVVLNPSAILEAAEENATEAEISPEAGASPMPDRPEKSAKSGDTGRSAGGRDGKTSKSGVPPQGGSASNAGAGSLRDGASRPSGGGGRPGGSFGRSGKGGGKVGGKGGGRPGGRPAGSTGGAKAKERRPPK